MRQWHKAEALAGLEQIGYILNRAPTLSDLPDFPGEAPGRSWWYRNYPGGWRQAVKDATGKEAQRPGHPRNRHLRVMKPGEGFDDPVIQAKAQANRACNVPVVWLGRCVAPVVT